MTTSVSRLGGCGSKMASICLAQLTPFFYAPVRKWGAHFAHASFIPSSSSIIRWNVSTWKVTDYSYFLIWYMGVTCYCMPHLLGAILVCDNVWSFRLWLISDVSLTALKTLTPPANSIIWTRWRSIHLFQFLVDFHGTVSECHAFKNVEPQTFLLMLLDCCGTLVCAIFVTSS